MIGLPLTIKFQRVAVKMASAKPPMNPKIPPHKVNQPTLLFFNFKASIILWLGMGVLTRINS